jgi:hypothetical protein
VLPARFDDTPVPGLLTGMVAVDLRGGTPAQFADLVVEKLADLAISPSPPGGADGGPSGGVRVSAADPHRLGVHAAISVPGVPDDVLPEYVPRDVDDSEFGVRAKVAAARERGGFVLLVGGSSVGKTRCAVEAVKALLPDWWLVHPVGPDQVAALAATPVPRTVVWLDELQRCLDGEHGLTGAVVRALLNGPHPAGIVGTLWRERYTAHTTLPAPGGADLHAREREVLDLADVVRIDPAFSAAEQDRARAAATRDPRLQVALESAGYGLTQTLAAAPHLVARWQNADPYAGAVLTAGVSWARRVLQRRPLFLDTETTTDGEPAEVVEVAVVGDDGTVLLDTLVRPQSSIAPSARRSMASVQSSWRAPRGWRPRSGVNEDGRRFPSRRPSHRRKDPRPWHTEYPLPTVSAATLTSCSPRTGRCRRFWRRWPGSAPSC